MENIVSREGDKFEILNRNDWSSKGLRLPISCLSDVITGFKSVVKGERFETETVSIGFFDDHLQKKSQIKIFFFIHILKIGKFLIWHRDDADTILNALIRFQNTNKRQTVDLSWPLNN